MFLMMEKPGGWRHWQKVSRSPCQELAFAGRLAWFMLAANVAWQPFRVACRVGGYGRFPNPSQPFWSLCAHEGCEHLRRLHVPGQASPFICDDLLLKILASLRRRLDVFSCVTFLLLKAVPAPMSTSRKEWTGGRNKIRYPAW